MELMAGGAVLTLAVSMEAPAISDICILIIKCLKYDHLHLRITLKITRRSAISHGTWSFGRRPAALVSWSAAPTRVSALRGPQGAARGGLCCEMNMGLPWQDSHEHQWQLAKWPYQDSRVSLGPTPSRREHPRLRSYSSLSLAHPRGLYPS